MNHVGEDSQKLKTSFTRGVQTVKVEEFLLLSCSYFNLFRIENMSMSSGFPQTSR